MLKTVGQALFSTGLQYPKHNVESKGDDYEVRRYEATNWVSTTLVEMDGDAAMNAGFRRLFKYIQGENERGEKVEMTAPVTCRIEPGAGPACESSFTVSFFIPEQHQADPPKPTSPDIYIENRPEFTAFVRTYGGFSREEMAREEHLKLVESLRRDGLEFQEAPYYRAGYDSPFKLINRKNEVWLLQ